MRTKTVQDPGASYRELKSRESVWVKSGPDRQQYLPISYNKWGLTAGIFAQQLRGFVYHPSPSPPTWICTLFIYTGLGVGPVGIHSEIVPGGDRGAPYGSPAIKWHDHGNFPPSHISPGFLAQFHPINSFQEDARSWEIPPLATPPFGYPPGSPSSHISSIFLI